MRKIDSNIAFYAFRYTLGRSSYAVDEVQQYILKNIDSFSERDILSLIIEIDKAFSSNPESFPLKEKWISFQNELRISIR